MNEVKKCSLSGVAFTMDVDAFETLNAYLDSLKKTYKDTADGAEIVADIEARIAELILSAQDNTRVVEKPLILNIIQQMGSVEDISEQDAGGMSDEPRIPRRLYRDTENAKLGGVCAGIGKYFDVDPVWIRLAMFVPVLLSCFGWLPFLHWTGPMMGNLFGIFVICYLIMWFAVPAARTARQRLEMNGERITAQSVAETTVAASADSDADSRAKPIVAEAVSVFGKVVLICLKLFAGLIVFGLIMLACALIIGLFTLLVGGTGLLAPVVLQEMTIWVPILGIFVVLIPVMLFIYVLMCLIASRKPGGRTVLVIFLLWIASIVACSCIAIRENVGDKFRTKRSAIERALKTEVNVDGQMTTLEQLLKEYDDESVVEEGGKSLHISVPSKSLDIMVDKKRGEVKVNADGKEVLFKAGADSNGGNVSIRKTENVTSSGRDTLQVEKSVGVERRETK